MDQTAPSLSLFSFLKDKTYLTQHNIVRWWWHLNKHLTADSRLMDNGTTCWIESRIDWLEGQWKHTASLKPYQDYLHTATKTNNMIQWRMALLNEWMIDFTFGEQDNQGSMIDSITLLLLDTPAILILLLLRYCSLDITATLLLQISLLDPFMLHLLSFSPLFCCRAQVYASVVHISLTTPATTLSYLLLKAAISCLLVICTTCNGLHSHYYTYHMTSSSRKQINNTIQVTTNQIENSQSLYEADGTDHSLVWNAWALQPSVISSICLLSLAGALWIEKCDLDQLVPKYSFGWESRHYHWGKWKCCHVYVVNHTHG